MERSTKDRPGRAPDDAEASAGPPRARELASVDALLRMPAIAALIERHGRARVVAAVRQAQADARAMLRRGEPPDSDIQARVGAMLEAGRAATLRPVFNLTGTVLHTNLGRAGLPAEALDEVVRVARTASTLEYDVEAGARGDRDSHVEDLLRRLTGAEAATIVNNNAAAVLLVLNTLALDREVPISRGELIEIGDSFRIPEMIARAGCRLREVGTTNRTHPRDYVEAIGPATGVLLKVHTSNYAVQGFAKSVSEPELVEIARAHGLPLVSDLGSGSLVDLGAHGLPREPTPAEVLAAGVDIVTFSGDKLLGGPQAGLIVGRAELIQKIKRNPLKRALRVDKMTLAALGAVLRLYEDPDRLAERLPTLRLLTRPAGEIEALAYRLLPALQQALGAGGGVEIVSCMSQIGSGALPVDLLPSFGLALRPVSQRTGYDARLRGLAAAFRALPCPVIGRLHERALLLDLRCLEDEAGFVAQLDRLRLP